MRVKLSWRGVAFLDRGSNRFGMAGCRWSEAQQQHAEAGAVGYRGNANVWSQERGELRMLPKAAGAGEQYMIWCYDE